MVNFSDLSSESGRSELLCQGRQTVLQEARCIQTILNDNLKICSTNLQGDKAILKNVEWVVRRRNQRTSERKIITLLDMSSMQKCSEMKAGQKKPIEIISAKKEREQRNKMDVLHCCLRANLITLVLSNLYPPS